MTGTRLERSFYTRDDVNALARELLGKTLVTTVGGYRTKGLIAETEAYHEQERACHAYGGKRTKRTVTLFREGGVAYVYLCYGMHHMFNVVTGPENIAQAVLIRAVEPISGVEEMARRRGSNVQEERLSSGPGTLSQAMGITVGMNGLSLCGSAVWVEDPGWALPAGAVEASPRIGVGYAGKDAELPWRYTIKREFTSIRG